MKTLFKIQKISMVVYMVAIIVTFIYALYFMTDYDNLKNFETVANKPIAEFYNSLQNLNFTVFYFAVFGLISFFFLFGLQIFKKVCDRLALIFLGVFAFAGSLVSILVFSSIPGLISDYKLLDLEVNPYKEQIETWSHTITFNTFYVGVGIYSLVLIASITLIASAVTLHLKFKKEMVGN